MLWVAFMRASTISISATAGNSTGIYSTDVPSNLTAEVGIIISPKCIFFCRAPVVPRRTKYFAPDMISSSRAMAAEGQPIPVEVTLTVNPLYFPV